MFAITRRTVGWMSQTKLSSAAAHTSRRWKGTRLTRQNERRQSTCCSSLRMKEGAATESHRHFCWLSFRTMYLRHPDLEGRPSA